MPWIQSHTAVSRNRKVLNLADALQLSPVHIVGLLHCLWHAVLEQQEDGDLSSWSDISIARAAMYEGDAVKFVTALHEQRFLDKKVVHDWWEYAGPYLTKKYHTSNPLKLQEMKAIHEVKSKVNLKGTYRRPKGSLKGNLKAPFRGPRGDEIRSDEIRSEESEKKKEEEEEEKNKKPPYPPLAVVPVGTGVSVKSINVFEKWNALNIKPCHKVGHQLAQRITILLKQHPDEAWWDDYFLRIARSDFLSGKKGDFIATLDWVLGPKNMAKIEAGNYENHHAKSGMQEMVESYLKQGETT